MHLATAVTEVLLFLFLGSGRFCSACVRMRVRMWRRNRCSRCWTPGSLGSSLTASRTLSRRTMLWIAHEAASLFENPRALGLRAASEVSFAAGLALDPSTRSTLCSSRVRALPLALPTASSVSGAKQATRKKAPQEQELLAAVPRNHEPPLLNMVPSLPAKSLCECAGGSLSHSTEVGASGPSAVCLGTVRTA